MFGFVFPLLPSEFLLKTSTHVSAELKGKEFVQTSREADMGRPWGQAWGPSWGCTAAGGAQPRLRGLLRGQGGCGGAERRKTERQNRGD